MATIGGLFLAAFIIALLGGGEDTPVIITTIMWAVCYVVIGNWIEKQEN